MHGAPLGEEEARVHHGEPFGVETALGFGVDGETEALFVGLAGEAQVFLEALAVVVGIDEILSCVIRRVDVDHLDLTDIGFLEELEDFEIVSLND